MRLISPTNVIVSVAEAKGEALKAAGYREVEVKASTPGKPVTRKRAPRKPSQTTD